MSDLILAADIGGTNTTLALVEEGSKRVVKKCRYSTKDIKKIEVLVSSFLSGSPMVRKACFAIAGAVENNRGTLTNASLHVDGKKIEKKTQIDRALIINDFEAMSHAIPLLKSKDLVTIKEGKSQEKAPMVVLGAGTGLGKALLIYDNKADQYFPIPSEAGHADLVVHTQVEFDFVKSLRKDLCLENPVSWENVLSGQGLVNIYRFISGSDRQVTPRWIGENRGKDPLCKETFEWFTRFLARCAKDSVLDHLAGKVFIAGGIFANNQEMCGKLFREEFLDVGVQKKILEDTTVYGIKDYDVSLIGCARALEVWHDKR